MVYRSKIRVLKMVAVVVAVFTFFWLPLYVTSVRVMFSDQTSHLEFYLVNHILLPLTQWLGLSSSAVNPIVYWLFSARFRTGYRELCIRCCCRCCGRFKSMTLLSPIPSTSCQTTIRLMDSNLMSVSSCTRRSTVNGHGVMSIGKADLSISRRTTHHHHHHNNATEGRQVRSGSLPEYSRNLVIGGGPDRPDGSKKAFYRRFAEADNARTRLKLQAISEF